MQRETTGTWKQFHKTSFFVCVAALKETTRDGVLKMPYGKHISTILVWKFYLGTRNGKLKKNIEILELKKFHVEAVYIYMSKIFNIDQKY